MCGLAGVRSHEPDEPAASTLLASLRRRGPEGDGWTHHAGWTLVHTRLAIIDLSDAVRYPLANETGNLRLVFNGEIYNHAALRGELGRAGHSFATACDAEVVLHGYEEWGLDVFGQLSGMFAVALTDARTGELVLARDRLGIKPLVRTIGEPAAFASDAMALVEAGVVAAEADRAAVEEFLAFHYVPPPSTGVAGVVHVEPGTAVVLGAGGDERVERWAPLPFTDPPGEQAVGLEELGEALRAALDRHLVSDVEVGLLLSGGVDSGLILGELAAIDRRPVSFTISFAGSGDYDEGAAARRAAQRFGARHRVDTLDTGFVDAVTGVAEAFDGPFADASAVATLAVARLAAQDVKVVLSGTGGDDLFAGYYRHRAHRARVLLRAVPPPLLRRLAGRPGRRGGERTTVASLMASYATRLARATNGDDASLYLSLAGEHTSAAALEVAAGWADVAAGRARVAQRLGLGTVNPDRWMREVQAFECRTYLPYDLLVKEDRATMAHGLESRVPLLDPALVAIAERMPDAQKASLRTGKRPLRALAERRLGDLPRVKRGFAVPLGPLLAGPWREEALAWLAEADSTLVDVRAAAGALRDGVLEPADTWALSALVAWEQRLARRGSPRRALTRR